jgi:Organic Anion Transporter Polypeptide (OATP) family
VFSLYNNVSLATVSDINVTSLPRTSNKFCPLSTFNKTESDDINLCNATSWSNTEGASPEREGVHPAYYVFVFAQLLSGVGTSGVQTLGMTYIDENAPKSRISLYIGETTLTSNALILTLLCASDNHQTSIVKINIVVVDIAIDRIDLGEWVICWSTNPVLPFCGLPRTRTIVLYNI